MLRIEARFSFPMERNSASTVIPVVGAAVLLRALSLARTLEITHEGALLAG
jgi:hypothetical protein